MSMRSPNGGFISAFYDPLKAPNAPTIGTATAGDTSISIAFTAPSNVGGSAITSYTAIATKTADGTLTIATGTSSPISITGLTNDTAYTVKVAATNTYGTGPLSSASGSVTPTLPIGAAYGGGYYAGTYSGYKYVIAAKSTQTSATYDDGITYCNNLVSGGYSDWEMPAIGDFTNVLNVYLNPGTTTAAAFQTSQSQSFTLDGTHYYSSTPTGGGEIYTFYFGSGGYTGSGSGGYARWVRAIRKVAA